MCVCVLGLFVLAFWAALKNEQVKTTAVTSPSVERTALLRGNWENVKVSNVVLCFVQIALKAWNSKNVKVFSETKRLCANSDQQLNNENMKLPVNIISPEWELIVQRLCYNCDTCTYTESKRDVWTMRHFTAGNLRDFKSSLNMTATSQKFVFFLHVYSKFKWIRFWGQRNWVPCEKMTSCRALIGNKYKVFVSRKWKKNKKWQRQFLTLEQCI